MIICDVLAETEHADTRTIRPDQTLRQAAHALRDNTVGALAVTDNDGNLIGVLTERALIEAIITKNHDAFEQTVDTLMTQAVATCSPSDEIDCVLSMMSAHQVAQVPVIDGAKVLGVVGILELTQAIDLLGVQVDRDPLTNLPNRECFVDRLAKEIERCNRYRRALSVARIDIDEFDEVVVNYGHEAGTKVVQALAELFFNEIRNVDFVGRVGADEFAVYFPETNLGGAKVACHRLLDKVRATKIDIGTKVIGITVSIGLTELGTKTAFSLGILNRADQLLCEAKADGRDRVLADTVLSEAKANQVA